MTSRLVQQPTRMLLAAATRRQASNRLRSFQMSVRPSVGTQTSSFSTGTSNRNDGVAPIHLKASANSADRPSLITAVREAVSASGGWLSQTRTNESCDIFVLEGVGSEQLAAFHSKLEALMMDWNQSTLRFLEECYFSLVQPPTGTSCTSSTAVLQLNWR
jgi:hypothetical protein